MSNEGKEVWQMTEAELQQLNETWVYWMNQLKHTISWYAHHDDDLTQIGIINKHSITWAGPIPKDSSQKRR